MDEKHRILYFIFGLLLGFLYGCAQSHAHDWYSAQCCSSQDCHPIDSCSEMTEASDGGVTWKIYHFSKEQVKPSQDDKCHVCLHNYGPAYGVIQENLRPICAYVQQGS